MDAMSTTKTLHKVQSNQRCIMDDLMDYLRRLSIGEANVQPQKQGELKHSPPGREVVSGGLNQQDSTCQDIEHSNGFSPGKTNSGDQH